MDGAKLEQLSLDNLDALAHAIPERAEIEELAAYVKARMTVQLDPGSLAITKSVPHCPVLIDSSYSTGGGNMLRIPKALYCPLANTLACTRINLKYAMLAGQAPTLAGEEQRGGARQCGALLLGGVGRAPPAAARAEPRLCPHLPPHCPQGPRQLLHDAFYRALFVY